MAVSIGATHAAPDGDLKLTILHTNDMHAHDEPFIERGKSVGGMDRIGHTIKLLKSKDPEHTIAVDAGDIFQGTPLFTKYKGEVEVSMLDKMGYDVYTIGNHEFDEGPQNLAKQLSKANFTILNCNMDLKDEPELAKIVKPYVIKTIAGQKVGFVGAITPDLLQLSMFAGKVTIKDAGPNWMKPIAETVKTVKDQGVNKIVLVTHVGVVGDKELAEALPDVDLIIGGHSHTRLDKAIVVKHQDGSSTTIVQTGSYGRVLGRLDVQFDSAGRVIDADTKYHLIPMTAKVQEDAGMKAYIDEKEKPLLALRANRLGEAKGDFDNYFRSYPWDSALGDLITDALVEEGKEYGVSVGLQNRGGMRARIDGGPITEETVEEVLPFQNQVTFATVTGDCLKQALERSVSGGLGGGFLDQHGLKLAYDTGKPKGARIVFALAQNKQGQWEPIDDKREYKIAINNFTFGGGEGYNFSSATNKKETNERIAVALEHYLSKHSTVTPSLPSRIVPVHGELLSLSAAGDRSLVVKGAPPQSQIKLFAGTGRGITPVDAIPVPLENPRLVKSGVHADLSGQYTWKLPLTALASDKDKPTWVCVIVQPKTRSAKNSSKENPLISYPLELN
ncbi:MAG TPA: bifunctional UDP-sugar hydrolase/5'-nucleotidase [Chroococcales cyanobacterium]